MTVGVIRTGNSTSIGTSTTKTLLSPTAGLFMPADGKALLAVTPTLAEITMTTLQSVSARLDIESPDVKPNMSPFEVLFSPIGAGLGGEFSTFTGKETWRINCPLQGGEALNIYGTALVANTVAPEAMAHVIVSNNSNDLIHPVTRQYMRRRWAKLGTVTNTGTTTDTDVAGTKYSISGVEAIVELFGIYHPKTLASGDAVCGGIKYTSSEFVDAIPQELPLYPFSFGLQAGAASGGVFIPGVSRQEVHIPCKPGQVNIQDYLNVGLITATQGSFVDGVVYV